MAAIPSSDSLVATHDYDQHRLGSTSRNGSCGSAECPGEAIPLVSPRPTQVTGEQASFSGSPLSNSWPLCWNPQSSQNLPRPPAA
ncbi:pancreatic progenitor cell differentiation and proliferation factor B-like [Sturnira hondurensis]|uniref:pancreatic progenitor cell differentiation and proliferation factor B-like n=1 Tax=Sturnira hondurensis TaxID=192404 RepID=UPI00187AA591|nr:pancreatic progenitor cell differentiation and proliferation factor B-like [Sturnira hondurensis]